MNVAGYFVTQQVPSIDSSSQTGIRPHDLKGNIEFVDVHFQYPSRPDVKVRKISLLYSFDSEMFN